MSADLGRLVLICGAGLSLAKPSCVPTAAKLAEDCFEKYESRGFPLTPDLRDDLSKLAQHFYDQGMLLDFITGLVDWGPFEDRWNEGHETIADFLGCGAFEFGLTTNYDYLVEIAAKELGEPHFQNAIHADELLVPRNHKPYLKIHGCCIKDDVRTVWVPIQLTRDPTIQSRVQSLRNWLKINLRGRDVLLVGFWTDWRYLNSVLEAAVSPIQPNRVVLVDPEDDAGLNAKAPQLWNWANSAKVRFDHVRESGADFLAELRKRFGLSYFSRLFSESEPTYRGIVGGASPLIFPNLSVLSAQELFELRRDSAGLPSRNVPRNKRPDASMGEFGALHLIFGLRGASLDGARYVLAGTRYRIVQGAGQGLGVIKSKFEREPTEVVPTDVVICAGARDDAGVTSVIRVPGPGGIVRPGSPASWLTTGQAIVSLGI